MWNLQKLQVPNWKTLIEHINKYLFIDSPPPWKLERWSCHEYVVTQKLKNIWYFYQYYLLHIGNNTEYKLTLSIGQRFHNKYSQISYSYLLKTHNTALNLMFEFWWKGILRLSKLSVYYVQYSYGISYCHILLYLHLSSYCALIAFVSFLL